MHVHSVQNQKISSAHETATVNAPFTATYTQRAESSLSPSSSEKNCFSRFFEMVVDLCTSFWQWLTGLCGKKAQPVAEQSNQSNSNVSSTGSQAEAPSRVIPTIPLEHPMIDLAKDSLIRRNTGPICTMARENPHLPKQFYLSINIYLDFPDGKKSVNEKIVKKSTNETDDYQLFAFIESVFKVYDLYMQPFRNSPVPVIFTVSTALLQIDGQKKIVNGELNQIRFKSSDHLSDGSRYNPIKNFSLETELNRSSLVDRINKELETSTLDANDIFTASDLHLGHSKIKIRGQG